MSRLVAYETDVGVLSSATSIWTIIMPALDFREIAIAHAGGERDQFELFARELLIQEGFNVLAGPDRGADDGRDLIVEETRHGPGGVTRIRWLVSCKHKAHSGNSVTAADDGNIRDRLGTHRCVGFISFYSTVPSAGLAANLEALGPKFGFLRYDPEIIERKLLDTPAGRAIADRFMPISYRAWAAAQFNQNANVGPAHPHDVRLLERVRELLTAGSRAFIGEINFGGPVPRRPFDPFDEISELQGAVNEFQDQVLNAEFLKLKEVIRHLLNLCAVGLYVHNFNDKLLTAKTYVDEREGYTKETLEKIREMNDAARVVTITMDSFEKIARERVPI